ncbi:hypothetical protein Q670_02570 [Alcanivorax sp. P2S70]|nr:hypothetical protein Q670_02570 [Alcanivorax sp. P2S70]|tara:strand:- start:148 stop:297 length:150 start_codon:yes stop_codon:yes gene_type:complete
MLLLFVRALTTGVEQGLGQWCVAMKINELVADSDKAGLFGAPLPPTAGA